MRRRFHITRRVGIALVQCSNTAAAAGCRWRAPVHILIGHAGRKNDRQRRPGETRRNGSCVEIEPFFSIAMPTCNKSTPASEVGVLKK